MVVRPFYDSLYDKITELWASNSDRVLLSGNAGTGKSWFEIFALLRLLKGYADDHLYQFVIRQVLHDFYLIDLATGDVRTLTPTNGYIRPALDLFNKKRALYFFEPLHDRTILPLSVILSSLTTLSPFEERTRGYEKNRLTRLMFPCWDYEHLLTIVPTKTVQNLDLQELSRRYDHFGGIIRHVLSSNIEPFEKSQKARIRDVDLTVLRAVTTGIDSDPKAPGKNVSGYLLSYSYIPTGATVPDRFQTWQLDFTSKFVREEIRKRMIDYYSIGDHIDIVVGRLNDTQEDRGGLHLQETVSFLLSKGTAVSWQYSVAGDSAAAQGSQVQWFQFRTRLRTVENITPYPRNWEQLTRCWYRQTPTFLSQTLSFQLPLLGL